MTQPNGERTLANNLTGIMADIARDVLVTDLEVLSVSEVASPPAGGGLAPEPPHVAEAPLRTLAGGAGSTSGTPALEELGEATLETVGWEREMSGSELISVSASGPGVGEPPGNMEEMQVLHDKYWGQCQAAFKLKRWDVAEGFLREIESISAGFLERRGACLSPDHERYVSKCMHGMLLIIGL